MPGRRSDRGGKMIEVGEVKQNDLMWDRTKGNYRRVTSAYHSTWSGRSSISFARSRDRTYHSTTRVRVIQAPTEES